MKKKMLRFAIPFHISNYEEVNPEKNKTIEKFGWDRKHVIQGESDLYDYITDLVGDGDRNSIATSWKLPKENYHKERFQTEISMNKINWKLSDIGLLVFSDEIGILWYEVDVIGIIDKNQFLDFAYSLKELSRGDNEKNYSLINIPVTGKEDAKYLELEQANDTEIIEYKEIKQGAVVLCKRKVNLFQDILFRYIRFLEIDSFFSNRRKQNGKTLSPDRGIAFSWVYEVLEVKCETDAHDVVFHLGRNYRSSYEMTSNYKENDFYEPFDDSIWYGSLEGCGNYTCPTKDKNFYNADYEKRLDIYYYIYLLCLGQYYSLLQLAQEVSMLPADHRMYSVRNSILEELMDKIHRFNLKNNYSQVGHLTQHNEFYKYLQNRLGINKMQKELEVELQSLYEMVDKKQKIRNAKRYKIITIISAIFVTIQTFANVSSMYESFVMKDWNQFCFGLAGIGVAAVFAVVILLLGKLDDHLTDSNDRKHKRV